MGVRSQPKVAASIDAGAASTMSLFETTQMLEQLPVPRDDAHQQVVPGRSNPYSRPEFSKGFDYSKWDNIDTDDDEEEKPLSPAKHAPQSAPVPTRAAPPAQKVR